MTYQLYIEIIALYGFDESQVVGIKDKFFIPCSNPEDILEDEMKCGVCLLICNDPLDCTKCDLSFCSSHKD